MARRGAVGQRRRSASRVGRGGGKVSSAGKLRAQLLRWRAGMRLMNEITAQEVRALTEKDRSKLIEVLFESARDLDWPDRTEESAEVAGRWNRLREASGARS